ncbi:dihydroneopterin aldolase [Alicyclobacillus cycloheptanicus]|uniref:7,8-dihydroneopterin aldolase n=1 Tax=Alicyclobacillus cycloheptanicus TaxID=1457 RepID=A0ABT9XI44_9BACL|nr:dihydroneopterin aldolase [Alicyclobacillus cycloheptanicus]MDQ0189971.1 dihydroneopterin aldolase [Alicyclobacillus cycloheptanicus]WDM00117.1 dihydroneopterin aldolase [Alicyclobacillus cycloheptanicus]
MDEIFLRGLQFFGRHGVLPEEQVTGQKFDVDVCIGTHVDQAAATDAVADTIDYGAVYELVKTHVEGEPVKLIERLAQRIAVDILVKWSAALEVEVEVRKPGAPVPGVFETMGVRVKRTRGDLDGQRKFRPGL